MLNKLEKSLVVLIAISFVSYFVSTVIGNDYLMDLLSPVTVALVFILLLSEIPRLGPFKWSTVAMAVGMAIWFVADVIYLYADFYSENYDALMALTDDIYLLPDACFAMCISIYMLSMLKGKGTEIAFLMANTLCFSICGFVMIYRFHVIAAGPGHSGAHWKELIFFFISFYIIMMDLGLLIRIGTKNIHRGTVITNIGIIGYAVLDLEYDFMRALGHDAENDYANLLYVLTMIFMCVGTTIQICKKYDFEFIERDFTGKGTKRRFFLIAIFMFIDVGFMMTGILTQTLGMYILITFMSYLITNYVLHSSHLNEELIMQQKEQNAVLEERIKEKTKDLQSANDQLVTLSSTDMLTGLYNRRSAVEILEKIHNEAKTERKTYAVFCADLNHFKPINDTYGHEMGDNVLIEIGKRLNSLPEKFTSFRMGGDEFLICLKDIKDHEEIETAADNIRGLFNQSIIHDNYIFNLSASIGIAIYPDDCLESYEILINYADNAMYDVKRSANKDGYKFFDKRMINEISKAQFISKTIANSIPEKDYILHFQPQIDVDSNEVIGVEVFPHLRGDMENISPAQIIPMAEECGLMSRLGIWIVKDSFETVAEWKETYGKNLELTINLSPLQLLDAEFIESLEKMSKEYGLTTDRIILDISSNVIMGAASSARDTMEAFHNYGFKLSLNDFGGNSINLSYLMNCGINYIKLSRNLISGVETDKATKVLIDSIMRFSSAMGIIVTAVGVETESQYKALNDMGITKMQGYLISKPVRRDEFEHILTQGVTLQ